MTAALIEPRTLKGFRDFLPQTMLAREALIQTAQRVYRSFGFAPIDTPALEFAEILLGKGGEETDRQMYRFRDPGDRDVAMRFDLTVPLARFVAQHAAELGLPFKRYHIATVWRGEAPQAGRFREFMQCDFDTIGSLSIATDIETVLVIHDLLRAIGFERFTIRINNRKLLNGALQAIGLADQAPRVLRAIDKLSKIGAAGVAQELQRTTAADASQIERILGLTAGGGQPGPPPWSALAGQIGPDPLGQQGLEELRQLWAGLEAAGAAPERFALDRSIARGLDYYTGTIVETQLDELPSIGSVCSGGRYDQLAELFTRQQLPGIGASLGLDRLLAAMEQLGRLPPLRTPAPVMVAQFAAADLGRMLAIASAIRRAGIGVELYPDARRIGQQLKYADRKGFRAVILAGSDELAAGRVQVKWLGDGRQVDLPLEPDARSLIAHLGESLAAD